MMRATEDCVMPHIRVIEADASNIDAALRESERINAHHAGECYVMERGTGDRYRGAMISGERSTLLYRQAQTLEKLATGGGGGLIRGRAELNIAADEPVGTRHEFTVPTSGAIDFSVTDALLTVVSGA